MAKTRHHMALSVKGVLMHKSSLKALVGCIEVEGRKLLTIEEVRNFLEAELAQGHELLPFDECEGFDYKMGCPGHVMED